MKRIAKWFMLMGGSWRRNARVLLSDVSFRRNLRVLGVIMLGAFAVFSLLWWLGIGIRAEVYRQEGGAHPLTFHEYLFSVLGAIDADPAASPVYALYSAVVRLIGAIIIGGVLTSFLCSLLERFSDMTLHGKLVPLLSGHTIIVGFTPLTDDIIRTVLSDKRDPFTNWLPYPIKCRRGEKTKVLLYTSGDVKRIRDTLNSVLDKDMEGRVVYAFGSMDMSQPKIRESIFDQMNILEAQSIIVLGDSCDPSRGDLKNFAFAVEAGGYVREKRIAEFKAAFARLGDDEKKRLRYRSDAVPLPFYVQMDDVPTFELMKRMEYKIGSLDFGKDEKEVCLDAVGAYIRPFSYYESWARMIWGAPYADAYYPLDFRPMDRNSYVHLVVAGLSRAGEALIIEALRICHYPRGRNTRITVVDSDPQIEEDFRAHHCEVFSIPDIEIDFKCERLQSRRVRDFLSAEARDPDCLLTVAICFRNIEQTLLEGLCLPPDIFYGYDPQEGVAADDCIAKRLEYPKYPPRVLVYQEHVNGDPETGKSACPARYRWIRPFGMQEAGVQTQCMRSSASMFLNAVFFWPIDADGVSFLDQFLKSRYADLYPDVTSAIESFKKKWKDSLDRKRPSEILAEDRYRLIALMLSKEDELLAAFKRYAFRRYVLMDPVKEWGNVYVPDSYGTILRSIGLQARKLRPGAEFNNASAKDFLALLGKNEVLFAEGLAASALDRSLEKVEHARWMADRALMGYRASNSADGEKRDDGYRYHNAMCPYEDLSEVEKNKDALVIRFIPMFLAIEGLAIVRREVQA